LLALCTAAVGAVYAGAYIYTEPTAAQAGTADTATPGATSSAPSPSSSTAGTSSSPSSTSPSPTDSSSPYKDGTYTASASNIYGSLSVAVRITGGKIVSVQITSYNMHYPPSYISPFMNNEVIKKQAVRGIYGVGGATASSYNFANAVYSALQKAKA